MAPIPTDAATRPAATLGSGRRCLLTRRDGPVCPLSRARSPAAEAPSSPVTASRSPGLAPERSTGGAADPETTLRCMEGVLQACEEFGIYPLGGDTTRADNLTVDVAILGELAAPAVLRSGARPGDLLAVTGELGASAAGLLALESGGSGPVRLVRKHLRPEPRVTAGRVAASLEISAMIDLSDGLASDVRRICEQSGVGCRVDLGCLPIARDTREFAESLGRDPETLAATGGEDYELLMAAREPVLAALAGSVEVPVTVIGEVTDGRVIFERGGGPVEGLSGWDHFSAI